MPEGPRARFEASLGLDLGGVRVHDGPASNTAASRLGARAFTSGRNIHFAPGQLQPEAPSGLHLLAHEVAHTVQQAGGKARGAQAKSEVSRPGDANEVEADRFADHIVHGAALPALSPASSTIQRQEAKSQDDEYYAEVGRLIQQLLVDYQNININAPTTPPPPSEPTAASTAEVTAEPTAEVTAEPTAADQPIASPTVPVVVSTPYWNNKYPNHNREGAVDPINNPVPPEGFDNGARGTAFRAYDDALRANDNVDDDPPERGTMSTAVAVAKGSPEQIESLVQNAVDMRVIAAPMPQPGVIANDEWWSDAWTTTIQQWMVQVGIGVDCNGLTFQAMLLAGGIPGARTTSDDGRPGVTDYYYPENATGVSTEAFGGDDIDPRPPEGENQHVTTLGAELPDKLDLEPGDIMYLSHSHVRIVMSVETRDRDAPLLEFTTAESTVDGRTQEGETYQGPRVHYWRWDGSIHWHRYEGSNPDDPDAWSNSGESPSYHRHVLPPAQNG